MQQRRIFFNEHSGCLSLDALRRSAEKARQQLKEHVATVVDEVEVAV